MPVKDDRSVGWTSRSVAVSLLLAMENHRKAAGLRLVQLREARGWNQEELAHRAGVSVKTVSRFENGRHDGRRTTVEKLAVALEIDEGTLMGAPPSPLGLVPDPPLSEGYAEIIGWLRAIDERMARVEDLLSERELADLEAEDATEPQTKRPPGSRRAANGA